MLTAICGMQVIVRKGANDSMLMLGRNKTIHQLATVSSGRWCGHVLRRSLDSEVEGQRKKRRLKRTRRREVEKEGRKLGLRREDVLC